jgi:hypothetical protein
MKRILIIILLAAPSLLCGQGVVSQLVEEIGGLPEGATMVNISGKMLKMAMENESSATREDRELRAFLGNVRKLSIVMGLHDDDDCRKRLKTLLRPFEELLSVVEDGMNISMLTLESDGETVEFVMMIDMGEMLVVMDIVGKIDLEQLAKLSKGLDINGEKYLENLDKLKNRKGKK